MADISARGGEGLGEMRRLDWTRRFEEYGRENQAFHEPEVIRGEGLSRDCVEVACRTFHREHGTLAKEGFNAHSLTDIVYSINHLEQDKSIVASLPGFLHDCSEVSFVVEHTVHRLSFFELVYESHSGHRERQESMDVQECVLRSIETGGCSIVTVQDRAMLTEIRV